jgi:hypothetical protein
MPKKAQLAKETLYILAESSAVDGVAKYGGIDEITVEKLREHLTKFVSRLGGALGSVGDAMKNYELAEVTVEASFSAEKGFVFVAKAGVEGAVKLTFKRRAI